MASPPAKRRKFTNEQNQIYQFPNSIYSIRLALILSYVGTRYNALQFQANEYENAKKFAFERLGAKVESNDDAANNNNTPGDNDKEPYQKDNTSTLLLQCANGTLKPSPSSDSSSDEKTGEDESSNNTSETQESSALPPLPFSSSVEQIIIYALETLNYLPDFSIRSVRKSSNLLRSCRTDSGVHAASNVFAVRVPADLIWDEVRNQILGGKAAKNSNTSGAVEESSSQKDADQKESSDVSGTNTSDSAAADPSTSKDTPASAAQPKPKRRHRKAVIPSDESLKAMKEAINAILPKDIRIMDVVPAHNKLFPKRHTVARYYRYLLPQSAIIYKPSENVLLNRVCNSTITESNAREFLQNILQKFDGTHSFHNFTPRIKSGQDEAFRTIRGIGVIDEKVMRGETYYVVQLHGQSFLYHQIRQMMGAIIAVCRGIITEDDLTRAMDRSTKMEIPLAPAYPLFLYEADYLKYNALIDGMSRWRELKLTDEVRNDVDQFVNDYIYPAIDAGRDQDEDFGFWIRQLELNRRSYFQPMEIEEVEKENNNSGRNNPKKGKRKQKKRKRRN